MRFKVVVLLQLFVILVACQEEVEVKNGANALIKITSEPAGLNCDNGGIKVESGNDFNINDILDNDEIASTTYVCDGKDGVDGINSLVKITDEPAGVNCPGGGVKIEGGLDANNDDILNVEEVEISTFVCDGDVTDQILAYSLNEPAGVNCVNGGVKFIVGVDYNENHVLDAEEIIEVSYLCSEEQTNPGKSYLILTGDITNEEAAERIQNEVGVNTQFVYVLNTTQLTKLDLNQVSELVELRIYRNLQLEEVKLGGLHSVYSDSYIQENALLKILDLSSLEFIYSHFFIYQNSLTDLNLGQLSTALSLSIGGNPQLESINLSKLNTFEVSIGGCPMITNLDFSNLTVHSQSILSLELENLTTLDLSNLQEIGGLYITKGKLSDVNLNKFTRCNHDLGFSMCDELQIINFPALSFVGGALYLLNNDELMAIDVNALSQVDGALTFGYNPKLETIDLPSLNLLGNIDIRDNHSLKTINLLGLKTIKNITDDQLLNDNILSSSTVNNLLSLFVSLTPTLSGSRIYLHQRVAAPPTGQGLIDKQTLIDNGNEVSTD